MFLSKIKNNYKTLLAVAFINILIFSFTNIMFDIKYEQVDDFIIYNLYSGLDGTYDIYGIYIHPLLCLILGTFFKAFYTVNWHTIYLLLMQFICFTIIGTLLIRKNNCGISYILYIIFASVCYTSLLQLIQYTSVSALLILTAFFVLMDYIERNKKGKKYIICFSVLFFLGIMTRMQSLLIIAPFFGIYFIYNIILLIREKIKEVKIKEGKLEKEEKIEKEKIYKEKIDKEKTKKDKILKIVRCYLILGIILVITYVSNYIIYNNDVYKNYNDYNNVRTILHDISYTDYYENKEIFDEIGWSQNDQYLFYTFNFGDENVFSKENLEKIVDYKISKDDIYDFDIELKELQDLLIEQLRDTNAYVSIMFIGSFLVAIYTNREKRWFIITIFLLTIAINILFIYLNRTMQRVVIPEFILGIVIFLYYIKYKKEDGEKEYLIKAMSIFIIVVTVIFAGGEYEYNYKLEDYSNLKDVIEYTNSNKENVYFYTIPSLQYRYLAYSVYEMPPKESFSNLRAMGGWDMYTKNYYNFKERYNLDGTFLDLLKENVYLIDGDVTWSGNYYHDYKKHIILFIKEHYNIDVTCEMVKSFDNIYIYKLQKVVE